MRWSARTPWAAAARAEGPRERWGQGYFPYNSAVMGGGGGAFSWVPTGRRSSLSGWTNSVTSLRAGAYAAGLARRQRARLVIVYVEQLSVIYGAAAAGGGANAILRGDRTLSENRGGPAAAGRGGGRTAGPRPYLRGGARGPVYRAEAGGR